MAKPNIRALSDRLREETSEAHASAERTAVMRRAMRGEIDHDSYVALLRALLVIYDELEEGLERHAAHPALGALMNLDMASLRRRDRLLSDIYELSGGSLRSNVSVARAAMPYAKRLRELTESNPALLAAHAYVRYMGDLSGGQMLRAGVIKGLGLRGPFGLSFFDFPEITDAVAFKNAFRAALDELATSDDLANAIVEEARLGFEMHELLFEQLNQ